eukprot:TRINITY_DN3305_c0_g1_i4.p1 TRINITY_DN3305_c0_g1~~TRINITY_DN3305_c0_g1_i4.p1  ORF type:complete len:213 (-),score=47.92 TRINITY_DN3305_c0_g1_i4:204-842(-)
MLRQIITLRSSLMKVRPSRPISIRFMADVVAEKDVLPTSTSLPSVPPKPLSFIDSLKSVAKSREEFKGFKVAGWVSGTLFVTYVLPIWTIYRTLTNQMETITTDIAALKNQMSVKDLAAEINLQNTRIENAMKLMDQRHQARFDLQVSVKDLAAEIKSMDQRLQARFDLHVESDKVKHARTRLYFSENLRASGSQMRSLDALEESEDQILAH